MYMLKNHYFNVLPSVLSNSLFSYFSLNKLHDLIFFFFSDIHEIIIKSISNYLIDI